MRLLFRPKLPRILLFWTIVCVLFGLGAGVSTAQTSEPLDQALTNPDAGLPPERVEEPGTTTTTGAPVKRMEKTSLFDTLKKGGLAMIPLACLSVIALALILVFTVTLRRGAVVTPRYMATVDALLRKKDYLGLLAVSNRHNEAVARIVQRTLDFATKNPTANYEQIREIAETEGTRQAGGFHQQITYLADIGAIAPMVGLLGTVLGMIKSFTVLSAGMAAAERSALLAEGVSEALIATAAGLVIGIPAMAFYALFRGRVQKLTADLEAAATQVLAILALHYAAIANSSRRTRREELIAEDDF